MARLILAAAAVALGIANAQGPPPEPELSEVCPLKDICFQLNIPDRTFDAGQGDTFLQITGPTSYSWIGLGQGDLDAGANMLVVYADGMGNITLSPRMVKGAGLPVPDTMTQAELLDGSGIADGKMTANIVCRNCDTWNGGAMNIKAEIATWMGAAMTGEPLDSADQAVVIMNPSESSQFPWNMVSARGGDGSNPFVEKGDPSDITADTGSQQPLWPGGLAPGHAGNSKLPAVHGALAALAFLVLFPSGAILVRFANFPKVVWVHAAMQIFSYLVFTAAAGIGIHMMLEYHAYSDPHPKIGMALLAYLFLQPVLGFIHHMLFKKKEKRTIISWLHVWGGRLAILLGIINGGFGLKLGMVRFSGYRAAYGVVATVMGVLFIFSIIFAEVRRGAENPSLRSRRGKGAALNREEEGQDVRMESMDRERLTASGGRVE